jgi:lysophospholipase L1-like esterase
MTGTRGLRLLAVVPAVVVLGCLAAACSTATGAPRALRRGSLVALGDSVPRGTNCKCRPYPPLIADGLSRASGTRVTATNDSVAGYTTASVLRQVDSDGRVINHIRAAEAVEIEIGANDVGYSKTCGTSVACYAPRLPTMKENLAAIVRRVRALTAGHKSLIVLLDYWSVWLGGKYAKAKGPAYVAAAEEMTDRVDSAIKSIAAGGGSAYVDLRAAFKGPSYTYDETHYLSSDGDHPNQAGHRRIAQATDAVIEKALHI